MTGFASCCLSQQKIQITTEFKSYNNRYLEIFCHLPPDLSSQEAWSREEIAKYLQRGKVTLSVKLTCSPDAEPLIDTQKIQSFTRLQQQLASLGILPDYTFSDLLNYGIFQEENTESLLIPLYRQAFTQALGELQNSRSREGAALLKDLQHQIQILKEFLLQIKSLEKQADEQTIEYLRQKFRDLLGDPIPEQRITEEIAAYLIKINVHEEIIRLETHTASLEELLSQTQQPAGRKMDFLCQELLREITTLGNKTPNARLQQIGVEVKNIIEKIREQARNVE